MLMAEPFTAKAAAERKAYITAPQRMPPISPPLRLNFPYTKEHAKEPAASEIIEKASMNMRESIRKHTSAENSRSSKRLQSIPAAEDTAAATAPSDHRLFLRCAIRHLPRIIING